MLAPKRDITQGKMTIALIESAFSGPFSPAVRASPRQEMSRIRDSVNPSLAASGFEAVMNRMSSGSARFAPSTNAAWRALLGKIQALLFFGLHQVGSHLGSSSGVSYMEHRSLIPGAAQ